MSRLNRISILGLAIFVAAASAVMAQQNQYIGYVYPAGGQQGTTFPIRLGGQGLAQISEVVVSGEGVSARLVDYYGIMSNEAQNLLRQQLNELKKKETTLGDAMAAKMASLDFPAPIGPDTGPNAVPSLNCPACGTANLPDATVCGNCKVEAGETKRIQSSRTGIEERSSQVREGNGKGETDRTDSTGVRG